MLTAYALQCRNAGAPLRQGALPLRVWVALLLSTEHHNVRLRSHTVGTCMITILLMQGEGLHVLQTRRSSPWVRYYLVYVCECCEPV